jgi:hypothetical protein
VPTRKQRRRREKTFRHEYDFVTYDEEGNEVELDPGELRKEKDAAPKAKPAQPQRGGRPVREVPPPSWRRAFRRGGLMGIALLFLMLTLVKGSPVIPIVYALALIPFTYWIDRFAYRNYLRRTGKGG